MSDTPAQPGLESLSKSFEPAALEALKATFGFVDGPIGTQFLTYVKSVFTWDLGTSVRFYPQQVSDVLGRAIGWTLFLVGTSTILSFSLGSIVGIFAAWYRGGRMDSILSPLTLVMQAIPPVVVSLLALFLFGVSLGWLPIGYAYSPEIPADVSIHQDGVDGISSAGMG